MNIPIPTLTDADIAGLEATSLRDANQQRQKEWDPSDAITLSFRGNELSGEVGEACNVIKKLERERLGLRGSRATVAQLADELADVIICADLIAMHVGIDLDGAVQDKFNGTSEKYGLRTRLARTPDIASLRALLAQAEEALEPFAEDASRIDERGVIMPHACASVAEYGRVAAILTAIRKAKV